MTNPFSWDYLTAPLEQTPTFGPFSTAYLVLFAFVFLFSIGLNIGIRRRLRNNPVLRHAIERGSHWMIWITAIGLFFFAFRWMRVEMFGLYMRIWMYLVFLAFVGVLVFFGYYLKVMYPKHMARIERRRQMKQYMPGAPLPRDTPRRRRAKQGVRTKTTR